MTVGTAVFGHQFTIVQVLPDMPLHIGLMKTKSLSNPGDTPVLRSQKDSFYAIILSLISTCTMEEFRFCLLSGGELNFHVKDIGDIHEKSGIFKDDGYNIFRLMFLFKN